MALVWEVYKLIQMRDGSLSIWIDAQAFSNGIISFAWWLFALKTHDAKTTFKVEGQVTELNNVSHENCCFAGQVQE